MGGVGSVNVDHDVSKAFMTKWRKEGLGQDYILVGIKDQNMTGKVYFCGEAVNEMKSELSAAMKQTKPEAQADRDDFDKMWDLIYHNTKMTSGYQFMSFKKEFFPIGKNVMKTFDVLGSKGFVPMASPNYGGPISDKASVDWPMIIFKKDKEELYDKDTLFMAVKDQNIPGKLCASGPEDVISQLKGSFHSKLKQLIPEVEMGFDEYDTKEEWDLVWRNTNLTSGMQAFSLAKPYFPKTKVLLALFEEVYGMGWELVCGPNFGGNQVDWPCFVFKKLKSPPEAAPQLVMAAVKDQNIPGKLCLSATGVALQEVTEGIFRELQKTRGNDGIKVQKDEYDEDHGQVIRNTSITSGGMTLWAKYFPKNESVLAITRAMGEKGYKVAGCPMFGGMGASWPCFLWHYTGVTYETAIVAVKDQGMIGKVAVGGVESDVAEKLLAAFKELSCPDATLLKDDFDEDFSFSIKHTKMTTGNACCSIQNSWWPYGYPMEVICGELGKLGWTPAGAPSFGSLQTSWPVVVFQRPK